MTDAGPPDPLAALLGPNASRAEADLERYLVEPGTPPELAEAVRYCALGGGKRLRPALVFLTAEAVVGDVGGRDAELAGRAAAAIEMIHSCSLVHDDLPAMDDDALRRGRPTAHVKYGEAMAILAGDALLTRAFGVLAESDDLRAPSLAAELAAGAGAAGMIAGQVADMDLCRLPDGDEALRYIPLHKTAALIRAATRMGARCVGASEGCLDAAGRYGETLGLAFQLLDDLLDVTGAAEDLGKTPGKDARSGKRTYVAQLGLERARALADELTREAAGRAEEIGPRATKLRDLADLLGRRTR